MLCFERYQCETRPTDSKASASSGSDTDSASVASFSPNSVRGINKHLLKFDRNLIYHCSIECNILHFQHSDEAVIPVHPIPPVASVPSVPLVAPVAPVPLVAAVPPGPLDHLIAPTSLPAQRRNIFNITLYLKTQPFIDLPVFVAKFKSGENNSSCLLIIFM